MHEGPNEALRSIETAWPIGFFSRHRPVAPSPGPVMMRLASVASVAAVAAVAAAVPSGSSEAERLAEIFELRDTIHTLPAAEQQRRFAALKRRVLPPDRQDSIDHFVVLYMENQAMLRTLGCMTDELPGLDGLSKKDGMYLPIDPKNKSKGFVNVTCGTGVYVCDKGPGFSFLDAFFEKGVDTSKYPYPPQSIENAASSGANGNAVEMFDTKTQLPVKYLLRLTLVHDSK